MNTEMPFYKRFLLGLGLTILTIIIGFGFWFFNLGMFDNIIFPENNRSLKKEVQKKDYDNPVRLKIEVEQPESKKKELNSTLEPEVDAKIEISAVPFTAQAPFADWSNPIYQDGCEEASVLMSIYWTRNKSLTKTEANRKLVDMAGWQIENYNSAIDTSVEDTATRLFRQYFGYENVLVKKNIALDDIINEINKGNLVIVPTNGRLLGNSNYTPPGPERHNLVIWAYNKTTDEFITNDPGTRHGDGYRYNSNVLFKAIRDYPTGDHEEINSIEKNMIVVRK